MAEPILRGAYVTLRELLALRYRRTSKINQAAKVMGTQAGNRLSKLRGRGIDFSEVRAYQAGDDVRTIDWRVTARKNKPHTKVFREERERLTLVVVDQTQSLFFGSQVRLKSVAAAEIAALSVWQALNHNDRVGGMIIGNEGHVIHKPYRNVKSAARFLGNLAEMNSKLKRRGTPPQPSHFIEALLQIRRLAHSNYRIYFISDFEPMAEYWRDAFRNLSRRNEVIALKVHDPLETELPPADSYTVTDGRDRWQFHTGNPKLRSHYQEQFEEHESRFKTVCDQTAVGYRFIATDQPLSMIPSWL